MDTTHNKDNGDKIWNNQQQKGDLNEGFSGENIPDNYNPAKLVRETETDTEGNEKTVNRARNADMTSNAEKPWNNNNDEASRPNPDVDDQKIKGTEDFNYDTNPQRYSADDLDNKIDRGNGEKI